ncbi:MAG: hypothetical protein E4G95_09100, partial [Bacteroidia bacterium]
MGSLVKSIFLQLIIMLWVLPGHAQPGQIHTFPLKVKKGSYIRINDTLRYFSNDTLLFIVNKYLNEQSTADNRATLFYDSLRFKASRNWFADKLYDLVIINSSSSKNPKNMRPAETDFSRVEGRVIRNITVERLNPFGRTIYQDEGTS